MMTQDRFTVSHLADDQGIRILKTRDRVREGKPGEALHHEEITIRSHDLGRVFSKAMAAMHSDGGALQIIGDLEDDGEDAQ